MYNQIRQLIKSNESELVLALGVILISLIGRLTAPGVEKQPITVEYLSPAFAAGKSASQNITNGDSLQVFGERTAGEFVASKNSTKYHLPDCSGAKRIAEHNKIWFSSKEEAESVGYAPAANCPGL